MKSVIAALTSLLFLASCEAVPSNSAMFPDLVEYSREKQDKAADEVDSGACPVLTELAIDYKVMRDQTRVATDKKIPKVQAPLKK